jgi:hypothetical protein
MVTMARGLATCRSLGSWGGSGKGKWEVGKGRGSGRSIGEGRAKGNTSTIFWLTSCVWLRAQMESYSSVNAMKYFKKTWELYNGRERVRVQRKFKICAAKQNRTRPLETTQLNQHNSNLSSQIEWRWLDFIYLKIKQRWTKVSGGLGNFVIMGMHKTETTHHLKWSQCWPLLRSMLA